jgi:hypothetical protein
VAAFAKARRYAGLDAARTIRARVASLSSKRSMMVVDASLTLSLADGIFSIAAIARDRNSALTSSRDRPKVRTSDRSHGLRNR